MQFIPDTENEVDELDLEIATVSVIWPEGSHHPVIDYTGCSGYEAEGLLRAALKRLGKANAKAMVFLEEGQEYEDEEEDEDGDQDD